MAQNNGFPELIIHRLKKKLMAKKDETTQKQMMQHYNKNGSLLHIIVPQYTRSPTYSNEPI
jgi:hypothetical protein